MRIYNFIRILGVPFIMLNIKTRRAFEHEQALHRLFSFARFTQTKTRMWTKTILMFSYVALCLYVCATTETEDNTLPIKMAVAFMCLFFAEVKIGISRDPENRIRYVREDIAGSGATEWFSIPWPFVIIVPLATIVRVRPVVGVPLVIAVAYALSRVFPLSLP